MQSERPAVPRPAVGWRTVLLVLLPTSLYCQPPGTPESQQQQLSFQLQAANAFLRTFSDHHLFSGTVAYVKANNLTFNAGFVAADAAAANAIAYTDTFPLGTGSLSYVSVAAYQLRDATILDIDQPVTNYLDPADFGYASQWCPDVYGQPHAGTPTGQPSSENMTGMMQQPS
ncbi:hypothetical protein WJX84_001881 [Apatococcus fuscideae]|uniref:Uncharacterized protein n=1 Tax=Apatococcus fuscideae TaxID=2026836 RepID=A0AAW1T3A9_9CHLO